MVSCLDGFGNPPSLLPTVGTRCIEAGPAGDAAAAAVCVIKHLGDQYCTESRGKSERPVFVSRTKTQ